MKRVIAAGGAGFIGSHLVRELVRRDFRVTVIDDLSTGRLDNIADLLSSPDTADRVQFVQGSITNLALLQTHFKGADYVFHLAAIASVPKSVDDPLPSHDVNVTGTLNVLLAAKENNVNKVIFSSSSAVYGDTTTLPQKEEMVPIPLSPYAVNKLTGEQYCQVFERIYNLHTVCLRYYNVYGPRQDPSSDYAAVIPKFISRALAGEPPIIFGDGSQTRDFVFVRDVVEANILAAESDASGVFNIGTGQGITINELARLILKIANKKLEAVRQPARPGDIEHSLADVSRAASFGYRPRYSMAQGLEVTVKDILGQGE